MSQSFNRSGAKHPLTACQMITPVITAHINRVAAINFFPFVNCISFTPGITVVVYRIVLQSLNINPDRRVGTGTTTSFTASSDHARQAVHFGIMFNASEVASE